MATPINNQEGEQENVELFDLVMNNIDNAEGGNDNVSDNSSNTESSNAVINRALKEKSKTNDLVSSIEADEQAEKIIDDLFKRQQAKKTFLQRFIEEVKDPIIAIILFIIFQSGTVSELLSKNLGRFLNNASGELGYLGVGVKATLFALVYYILKKLLS